MISIFSVIRTLKVSRSLHYLTSLTINTKFSTHKNPLKIPKPTLSEYEAIKNRQNASLSQQKHLTQQPFSKEYNTDSQPHTNYRCDGCNTYLQSKDNKKYGFINEKTFKQAISANTNLIQSTYGERIVNGDAKVIDFLHEIQKQANIQIFGHDEKQEPIIKNLDNISVLLTLQQKIDKYEQENQTLKRSKKIRKELLCYRCHSLKYHNHLPEQYDQEIYEGGLNLDRQFVLEKVFNRHKSYQDNTHYLFVVDALDIFGTLRKDLVIKLLEKGIPFSVVINKCDILNDKYLLQNMIHQEVKKLLKQHFQDYEKVMAQNTQYHNFSAEEKLKSMKIFFVSSTSRQGVKKIEAFMEQGIKRIQLFGVPNTGKTSLLNKLLNSNKITSKIPGTTIRVSEFTYRKKIKVYDMPGLHYTDVMYNLISKPSLKSILTWNKFYSPPLMTHSCFIYGGKIEGEGLRIIPFGLGGCCSSDNRWFILNYKEFWKGLPELKQLQIIKHQHTLVFKDGKAQDLEIAGYGFVSFKPCISTARNFQKKLTFYLPQKVSYRFRESVLKNENIYHLKSAFTKTHQLERIKKQSNALA